MNQKEIDELYAKSLGYDTFNYNDKQSRNENTYKYNIIVYVTKGGKIKQ